MPSKIHPAKGRVKPTPAEADGLKVHNPQIEIPRNLPRYVGSAELAKLLCISRRTLIRWKKLGLVPRPLSPRGWCRWPRDVIVRWLSLGQPDLETWKRLNSSSSP